MRTVLIEAWRLAWPYFRSEERWIARGLLATVVTLSFAMVGANVLLNNWNGAIYDSLQNKNAGEFTDLLLTWRDGGREGAAGFMPGFVMIVAVYVPMAIYRRYLNQLLTIRWRRWMTERLLTAWLSGRAYYTLSLVRDPGGVGTDNPDQRIAEDISRYVTTTLSLSLGFLSNVVNLVSFAITLWILSGAVTLLGITIPGYMLWAAVIYAIFGTWATHLVGRKLVPIEFQHERTEADFRFSLARLRENVEGIALYRGEAAERANLLDRFAAIVMNFRALINRQRLLNMLVITYDQAAVIFPLVVAAPRYFSGQIALGALMRTAGAFNAVQGSLSWFVEAYAQLAAWRATVQRLAGFERAIGVAHALADQGARLRLAPGQDIVADGLALRLPDGTPLYRHSGPLFHAGESTVISGRSGSGKSTLFRALAGIWPYGEGAVQRPPGRYLFLPQRPYIPLGTLRAALVYPGEGPGDDAATRHALDAAGLGALVPELDTDQPWAQRLSGGEQQRLAVARAILQRPDWLFLDEATASLDPEAETALYAALRRELPDTTLISIAHRPAVAAFHERAMVFGRGGGVAGELVAQS